MVFPSGYADPGETVAHTIIREAREETGLHIVIVALMRQGRRKTITPYAETALEVGDKLIGWARGNSWCS